MLEFLQSHAYWYGEESAFKIFSYMNKSLDEKEHSYSWFRDQVIHPHETQHTFEEISGLMKELNLKIISTSINKYKSLKKYSYSELISLEKDYQSKSYKSNVQELNFNPGFFTICAQKI